tara:strand:+ start:1685 stop:2491 length:807 start_codon:yes stop_codon:yes gene_type:complete
MSHTISWIMQVYLGDYVNAPSNSIKKFKRAVKSFLDMKEPDSTLIIANDGCHITHDLYFKHFEKYKQIKYVFIEKTSPKMYEEYDGPLSLYHRVGPRQLARQLVDTTLTAYLDSDDFLLPNACEQIKKNWAINENAQPTINFQWAVNSRWYDNIKIEKLINDPNYKDGTHGFNEYVTYNNPIKIKGLNNKWIDTGIRDYDKKTGSYAFNYVHKSNINTRWQDSVTGGDTITGLRPDVSFSKKMRSTGPGMIMTSPYYVRCHYLNLWDY